AAGGFALAVVPQAENVVGWRAPYVTAVAVALLGLALLGAAPADRPRPEAAGRTGVLFDRSLYRLAVVQSASLGLGVTVGNWVVKLLDRHGGLGKGAAGAVGSLTLALGIVTRPLGGWILREHPRWARPAVGASLAGGAAGTLLLAVAQPPGVAALGAALVRVPVGVPFAPSFPRAALPRPGRPRGGGRARHRRRRGGHPRRHAAPRALVRPARRRPRRLCRRRGAVARGTARASERAPARCSRYCSDAIALRMISAASPASAGLGALGGGGPSPSLRGAETTAPGRGSATRTAGWARPPESTR